MGFLHNETTATTRVLVQNGSKSTYVDGESIIGHLKPYSLSDTTFDVSKTSGKVFKFTAKGLIDIDNWEKLNIEGVKYIVSATKQYKGIRFNTTKILLTTK